MGQLYGYGHSKVLFKPTNAAEAQFRDTAADAMSYFVGHEAVEGGHAEDSGFAINGGKGWSDVRFENNQTKLTGDVALDMGNYYFTCAQTGSETKVEYTFGYKKGEDDQLGIFLHHSSVPFSEGGAAPDAAGVAISEEDVAEVQASWANAIKTISRTYLDGGDYVGAAGDAAGQLYGYGHSKVLFKPTKAAEAQFRDTAADAMSYFVGHEAVEGGHKEDSGFAINGGKGWSDVRFENHQTKLTGDVAIAMGNYYFTCAQTRSETKVEYTFGYKRVRTAICASSSTTRPCHMRSSFLIDRFLTCLLRCFWEERHLRRQFDRAILRAPIEMAGARSRVQVADVSCMVLRHHLRVTAFGRWCFVGHPISSAAEGLKSQRITEAVLLS